VIDPTTESELNGVFAAAQLHCSLQWVTKRAKLPVVYWGSVSQAYENTKVVSLIAK